MAEKKGLFSNLFGKKETQDAAAEAAKAAADAAAAKQAEALAAAEAARQKAESEAKAKAEELAKLKAEQVAQENQARVEQAERYAKEAEARKAEFEARKLAAEEAAKNAVIATHTVTGNDTLSGIALHYYGHATPPYYKLIYEFNKEVIGPNMNIIVPGQVLQIPKLPEDFK